MCGRFAQIDPITAVTKTFFIDEVVIDAEPSYNVAPGQEILTIYQKAKKRILTRFKWGLVPFWAKDPAIGNRLINARSETVFEKPGFKQAVQSRRCLIIANGFYEWKEQGNRKVPFYIYLKERPLFGFAGLFEHWSSPQMGTELDTCTILTTNSNERIAAVHNRMPVILSKQGESSWLDPGTERQNIVRLFEPYPQEEIDIYEVSPFVNSPRNNSSQCIEKV